MDTNEQAHYYWYKPNSSQKVRDPDSQVPPIVLTDPDYNLIFLPTTFEQKSSIATTEEGLRFLTANNVVKEPTPKQIRDFQELQRLAAKGSPSPKFYQQFLNSPDLPLEAIVQDWKNSETRLGPSLCVYADDPVLVHRPSSTFHLMKFFQNIKISNSKIVVIFYASIWSESCDRMRYWIQEAAKDFEENCLFVEFDPQCHQEELQHLRWLKRPFDYSFITTGVRDPNSERDNQWERRMTVSNQEKEKNEGRASASQSQAQKPVFQLGWLTEVKTVPAIGFYLAQHGSELGQILSMEKLELWPIFAVDSFWTQSEILNKKLVSFGAKDSLQPFL